MNHETRLGYLIDYLSNENPKIYEQMSEKFLQVQNAFLKEKNNKQKITSLADLESLQPQLYLLADSN